jgi:large subunit ribosomal protein L23
MKEPEKTVKAVIRTEKSSLQEPEGKYLFWVEKSANKIKIRRAIEEIYKKKVAKVNTIIMPGKKKRVRYKEGYTSKWKKAMVTLKKGEKIDVA